MSKNNDGGPAFPAPIPNISRGKSLRDWFAAQVVIGIGQHLNPYGEAYQSSLKLVAKTAYELADAMLLERSRKETA